MNERMIQLNCQTINVLLGNPVLKGRYSFLASPPTRTVTGCGPCGTKTTEVHCDEVIYKIAELSEDEHQFILSSINYDIAILDYKINGREITQVLVRKNEK